MLHRIATSRRYTDSLHVIATEWGLQEVLDANAVLEEFDRIAAEAEG